MKITNGTTSQMVQKELGTRIQKIRLDMNIKQAELSKKSGVSLTTIYRIESGEDVGFSKIIAVLLAMGMSSELEAFIPEEILNPIEASSLGHSRKRATKKKNKSEKIVWGE
jgi:putative transcriptional regulator